MSAPVGIRQGDLLSRSGAGFTLVELLVAMTLLGLISVILIGGLRFGTRAWEVGDARAEALAEIDAVQNMMRRQIGQARIPRLVAQSEDSKPLFIGEEERLRLVTSVPAHLGVGGLYQVEIKVVEEEGKRRLDLAWHLFRPDDPDALDKEVGDQDTLVAGHRTLLENVEEAAFSYFRAAGRDPSEQDEWVKSLDEADGLPDLVSLKIKFVEGSGLVWPDLVVRPRFAGDDLRR
jgi:general secretion pathway protein J